MISGNSENVDRDLNQMNEKFQELDLSKQLPIYSFKDEILNCIIDNRVVIVHGETGSGKTTQIPKYLYDHGLQGNGMIGITQPRRIGAINMAKRVAEETHCAIGKEIGYEIRFDNSSGASTKVKYMTDGILLNQCISDPNLKDYGIIMIDEAHERALRSDVLLGLLKSIVSRSCNIKVIVASATMDTNKFSQYFYDAPIIYITGKLFPVEIIYEPLQGEDYIYASVRKVIEIHRKPEKGDILVFLTSQDEIEKCTDMLNGINDLLVLPLFSALEYDEQQKVFEQVKENERKAIISTNIAETSLTIDGVRFIIDCGYVKQSNFNARLGIDIWEDVRISKAQANQRKGRAGRTSNGWCYRMYGESEYNRFLDQEKPEIQRKNLSEIYLKVVAFGLNPKTFEFIDPPSGEALSKSEKELKELKFLDKFGDITEEGRLMENFPVEPIIGKIILSSISNKCVGDMIIILSMLTERNIFFSTRRDRFSKDPRIEFFDDDGDPFTLLKVYKEWLKNEKSEIWCKSHLIDYRKMEKVYLVQQQLILILKRQRQYTEPDLEINKEAIKKSIFAGYHKNVCQRKQRFSYSRCFDEEILFIHPSSSLFYKNPEYILYEEVRKTKKPYMHGVMKLDESYWKKVYSKNPKT